MILWRLIGADGNIVERYYITVDGDKLTMEKELDILRELGDFKRRKDDDNE